MLHEVLLALAGNPSPLLQGASAAAANAHPPAAAPRQYSQSAPVVTPTEQALLARAAHLSDLHARLQTFVARISASHGSVICRAVASAVDNVHLAAFRQRVLDVEATILSDDPSLVGAYNIVPLTAVLGRFGDWTRRLEWLLDIVQFIAASTGCTGAMLLDRLQAELQTGYRDIEETATHLLGVSQTAWVKQATTWMLYGRLPSFGGDDFFIQPVEGVEADEFTISKPLLPGFVIPSAAASMLFVGSSIRHVRDRSNFPASSGAGHLHVTQQLVALSHLTYPLQPAAFARTITSIRLILSRTVLQHILPQTKVLETLVLIRDFLLLSRGEFAMALIAQSDERLRTRWRRADHLAYEAAGRPGPGGGGPGSLGTVVVKEGELASALARTWAAMGAMQGAHADEDEGLELARSLVRLVLPTTKREQNIASAAATGATSPFAHFLFGTPTSLELGVSHPLDLLLTPRDMHLYADVSAFLLALRRAHTHLTDLWKVTALRRTHPAPLGPPKGSSGRGLVHSREVRARWKQRDATMRSVWAASTAAIFLLAEMEAYFQGEIVSGLWEGFVAWTKGGSTVDGADTPKHNEERGAKEVGAHGDVASPPDLATDSSASEDDEDGEEDIWLAATPSTSAAHDSTATPPRGSAADTHPHDPQTLRIAHASFLRALTDHLLLRHARFTTPLAALLTHLDALAGLVHRLHAAWAAADLETDHGVLDALGGGGEKETREVIDALGRVEKEVRRGIRAVIKGLRDLEALRWEEGGGGGAGSAADGGDLGYEVDEQGEDEGGYRPAAVGGVDRLLMKLDFGMWTDGDDGDIGAERDEYE